MSLVLITERLGRRVVEQRPRVIRVTRPVAEQPDVQDLHRIALEIIRAGPRLLDRVRRPQPHLATYRR